MPFVPVGIIVTICQTGWDGRAGVEATSSRGTTRSWTRTMFVISANKAPGREAKTPGL